MHLLLLRLKRRPLIYFSYDDVMCSLSVSLLPLVSLPARMAARLSACLVICLPVCLPACLRVSLCVCVQCCEDICTRVCMCVSGVPCVCPVVLSCLHACLPAYVTTHSPCLSIFHIYRRSSSSAGAILRAAILGPVGERVREMNVQPVQYTGVGGGASPEYYSTVRRGSQVQVQQENLQLHPLVWLQVACQQCCNLCVPLVWVAVCSIILAITREAPCKYTRTDDTVSIGQGWPGRSGGVRVCGCRRYEPGHVHLGFLGFEHRGLFRRRRLVLRSTP